MDETARLLVKSDLDRLKDANLRQNLLQAEQMVSHAYQVYVDSGKTTVVQRALGLMMVRLSLILVKKEKLGCEKMEVYQSPEHVAQLFAKEAMNSAASGSAGKSDGNEEEDEPALSVLGGLSLGEQALLQNKHLKKDGKYMHADYPDKIFVFTGLENDEAQFVHTSLYGSPETVLVPPDIFRKWKATRLPLLGVLAKDAAEGLMCGKVFRVGRGRAAGRGCTDALQTLQGSQQRGFGDLGHRQPHEHLHFNQFRCSEAEARPLGNLVQAQRCFQIHLVCGVEKSQVSAVPVATAQRLRRDFRLKQETRGFYTKKVYVGVFLQRVPICEQHKAEGNGSYRALLLCEDDLQGR